MPIVFRVGPYAFGFYASDRDEPPHVHVRLDRKKARYWLSPIAVANAGRLRPHELTRVDRMIREHHGRLLEAWHDFFNR